MALAFANGEDHVTCLLYTSFQPPHLVDEGFHDDDGHDGEQFAVFFNRIYLEDDEPVSYTHLS